MSIPEEMIMNHLDTLLAHSEPGDALHRLSVIAGVPGPLGTVAEAELKVTIFAIVDSPEDAEQFVVKVIAAAGVEHAKRGEQIQFAALSQEVWSVISDQPDAEAVRLAAQRRLFDHPQATEATMVYAAARDGRRWRGRRFLTGPDAGVSQNVDLLVGRPSAGEGFGLAATPFLLALVGIGRPPGGQSGGSR